MLNGHLEKLPDFIRTTLVDPNALSTLDLSFNVFTEIPSVRKNQYFNDIYSVLKIIFIFINFFLLVTFFPR
jgi:hypothetical protein